MGDQDIDWFGGSRAQRLAEYAASTACTALPPDVLERAKLAIFDECGCELIGRELTPGRVIADYVRAIGGRQESRLVGTGDKVPAPWAALANGTAGHADEFDGVHTTVDHRGTGHGAPAIIPGVTAVAERIGASGAELVNAVTLAYDVGARIISTTDGLGPLRANHGMYAGSLHAFGVASGCARLLGLSPRQHLWAIALAANQTLSLNTFFAERTHMSKALVEGQAAFAGVNAALLVAAGFEACDNILEQPEGVLATWGVEGRADELVRDLGVNYEVRGVNFKFYSAGYPIHSAAEAALTLTARHSIAADDIDRVEVRMPSYAASIVDNRSMPSICMQDMLAVALVAGRLGFDEAHSETLLADPRVRRLRSVVTVIGDPDFDLRQPHGRGSKVTIFTSGGAVSHTIEHPRGHRFRTPSPGWTDLRDKWGDILTARLGAGAFDEFYDACVNLERIDDLEPMRRLLAVTRQPTHT